VRLLLATCSLLPLTACSSSFLGEASVETTDQAFTEAAHEFDVPRDLLVALGWTVTRLETPEIHGHGGESATHHGIMGLAQGAPTGPSLDAAAEALGVGPQVLSQDEFLNILGAASELRAQADAWEDETDTPIESLGDWAPIVSWYAGIDDPGMQRSFARDVYRWIDRGLDVTLSDGERIVLPPQDVQVPSLGLEPLGGVSSDYGGTSQFIAAYSGNYSNDNRGVGDIDTVVIHTAQGSYSGTAWWFADPASGVSAHYVLRSSDGEVTQMVWEEDVAWHAGHSNTNDRSIGIEQEGYVDDPSTWYTEAMYQSMAALVSDICSRYSIPCDRGHIIGHHEVPGCSGGSGGGSSCHTDPGSGYDWDHLMSLIGGSSGSSSGTSSSGGTSTSAATGGLVGFVRADDVYDTTAGIGGATVTLSDGQVFSSDSDGWFEFSAVAQGVVNLTVSKSGYSTLTDSKDIASGLTNWNSVALTATSSGSSGSGSSTAGYSPTDWETVYGPEVTMDWPDDGAPIFQVEIWYHDGVDWRWYHTYSERPDEKTFWPVVDDAWYAWTVRSFKGGWTAWSDLNYFWFEN